MKSARSPGSAKSLSVATMVAAIAMAAGCGGSTPSGGQTVGPITGAAQLGQLMEVIAVPLAALFAQAAATPAVAPDAEAGLASLTSPVTCPGGGIFSYASPLGIFNNCNVGGVVIGGSVAGTLSGGSGGGSLDLNGGGTLTLSGNASGTLNILYATIQWTNPVNSANTYWRIVISVNGAPVCAQSSGVAC